MNLTSRQQQILDLIIDYIETTGFPPTRANIAEKFGSNHQMLLKNI